MTPFYKHCGFDSGYDIGEFVLSVATGGRRKIVSTPRSTKISDQDGNLDGAESYRKRREED